MGAVKRSPVRPSIEALKAACEQPDWEMILRNGGPPCFHVSIEPGESDPRFCLRAERWAGHGDAHPFVSLFALVTANSRGGKRPGAGAKPKVDAVAIAALRRRRMTWDEVATTLQVSRWTAMRALKRVSVGQ